MSIINKDFEWYEDDGVALRPRKQTITFGKRSSGNSVPTVSFDIRLFNEPAKSFKYVMMGFNKENYVIAIKPIECKVPGSYKICSKQRQREKITPGRFLEKHGLWHAETTDYEPEFDEDRQILLVAIDKGKLVWQSYSLKDNSNN